MRKTWLLTLVALSLAAPASARVVVLRAAGDIACAPGKPATPQACGQDATARLLTGADAVLALGDLQYERGSLEDFRLSYAPSWGRWAARTLPVPGNHEYLTPGAAGYFDFWKAPLAGGSASRPPGARGQGYYALRRGGWLLLGLNSECDQVSCTPDSAQTRWLRQQLRHSPRCTLAFWHRPRWSSGMHGPYTPLDAWWQLLVRYHVEAVLAGHDHHYERFGPLDALGRPDPAGVRSWVVGTGGGSLRELGAPLPGSLVRREQFGVLELRLGAQSWGWRFLPVDGAAVDRGAARCR